MDWIDLAQVRDQWKALVNTVMNFGLNKILWNSCLPERLTASHVGLSSVELVGWLVYIALASFREINRTVYFNLKATADPCLNETFPNYCFSLLFRFLNTKLVLKSVYSNSFDCSGMEGPLY
jgi:hypothetical protein